ncbi:MAG: hypothetical protein J6Q65_03820, partial [Lentisphaeria bacterium]|nr:hypothetical protein [Lentisphaeria bacterium]
LLLAAVVCWKKPFGKFYWLIAGTILYMILWRVAILIISSRYGAILIYPVVIATVFLCFKIVDLIPARWKQVCPDKVWRILPLILIVAFCIVSLAKSLRVNPYDPIQATTAAVRDDIRQNGAAKPYLLADCGRQRQYQYYSGCTAGEICESLHARNKPLNEKMVCHIIRKFKQKGDVLYLFAMEKADTAPIQLKIGNKVDPDWTLLKQEYINRRQQYVLRVYRCRTGKR